MFELLCDRYLSEQNISVTYINISRQVNACHIDFEQMGYDLTQKLLDYKHNTAHGQNLLAAQGGRYADAVLGVQDVFDANASLSADCIARSRYLFDNAGYCLLSTELPIATILEAAKTGRQAYLSISAVLR